jgi:uncharacterized protein (TIGR00369 family)
MFNKTQLKMRPKMFKMFSSAVDFAGLKPASFRKLVEEGSPWIAQRMQCKVESLEKGKLQVILPYQECFLGNRITKAMHGGVISSFLDHVGGMCAWSTVPKFQFVSTIDLRIDYLRPAPCQDLICKAEVKGGGRLIRADMELYTRDGDKLLAEGRAVYNMYTPPSDVDVSALMERANLEEAGLF